MELILWGASLYTFGLVDSSNDDDGDDDDNDDHEQRNGFGA